MKTKIMCLIFASMVLCTSCKGTESTTAKEETTAEVVTTASEETTVTEETTAEVTVEEETTSEVTVEEKTTSEIVTTAIEETTAEVTVEEEATVEKPINVGDFSIVPKTVGTKSAYDDKDCLLFYKDALARTQIDKDMEVEISFFDWNKDGNLDMLVRPNLDEVTIDTSLDYSTFSLQYYFDYSSTNESISQGTDLVVCTKEWLNFGNKGYRILSDGESVILVGYYTDPVIDGLCLDIFDYPKMRCGTIFKHGENTSWKNGNYDSSTMGYYGTLTSSFVYNFNIDASDCKTSGIGNYKLESEKYVTEVENILNSLEPVYFDYSVVTTIRDCENMSNDEFLDFLSRI